jgi:putative transposase
MRHQFSCAFQFRWRLITAIERARIESMYRLAGLSRAANHRHWQTSAPRPEETGVRDGIQHLALANRRYGHWRIGALLSLAGWRAGSLRRR